MQLDRAGRQASQLELQCVEDIYASQVLYIYLYTVLSLARSDLPNLLTGRQVIVLAAVFSRGVLSVSSAVCT